MRSNLQLILIRIYFAIVSRLFPSLAVMSTHRLFHISIKLKKYGKDWEDIFNSKFHVPTLIFHNKDVVEETLAFVKLG